MYVCVNVSILSISAVFRLHFRTVQTVGYVFFILTIENRHIQQEEFEDTK